VAFRNVGSDLPEAIEEAAEEPTNTVAREAARLARRACPSLAAWLAPGKELHPKANGSYISGIALHNLNGFHLALVNFV
jgi:hypothetical protein